MERFDRLLEEQKKAVRETDKTIVKLREHINDYAQLRTRLEDISKRVSQEAIIPFSPRALVPGLLVHTNELLVYLGGSAEYLCEVSTFQSLSIIDRRIGRLNREIKRLEQQRKLLTDREAYTRDLVMGQRRQNVATCDQDEVEIREEFDPEKEKQWQANHKKRIHEQLARKRTEAQSTPSSRINKSQVAKMSTEAPSDKSANINITFRFSDNPPPHVNPAIPNWHKASPADVVAFIQKQHHKMEPPYDLSQNKSPTQTVRNGFETGNSDKNSPSTFPKEPFSRVVERNPDGSNVICHLQSNTKPVSRFRTQRIERM